MFKALVLSLAAMVLVVLGVGQLLATRWQVETVRVLRADPARVAALVRDLGSWQKWSAIEVNLGAQTARQVTGDAGSGAQRIEWSGQLGQAVLTATAVTESSLDYRIGFLMATPPSPGQGRVEWQAVADGTRVRWLDEGSFDSIILRWFGWFGALQERVKQIQSSSLEALEQELERANTPPK